MLAITIDIDWAPDEVIEYTFSRLNDHNVPTTVFSTHNDGVSLPGHERALHPNFGTKDSVDSVLENIRTKYPEAIGIRSHTLEVSTPLRSHYSDYVDYESNYMMYGVEGIRPFLHYGDVIQFPVYYMDDVWLRRGCPSYDIETHLSGPGLRVFTFHPVHIFLNTPSMEYYEMHKDHYHDPDKLLTNRYHGRGIADLFEEMIDLVATDDYDPVTLADIAAVFREDSET